MFITQRFMKKLKSFLSSIDYPYADRYYPEIVKKLVYELMPNGQTIHDIGILIKEYRYVKNRQRRIERLFSNPVLMQTYQSLDIGIINNSFTNQTPYEKVVITNAFSKGLLPYTTFQMISTFEGKNHEVKKSGRYFFFNNSDYKLKTLFSTVELFYREDVIMKFSMSHWGKKYRFKKKIVNDYLLDQEGQTFYISRLNLDRQKELIGKVEIEEFVTDFLAGGAVVVHVLEDTLYDLIVLFGLGLLFSMVYAENQSRSA
jgi:hypothetical protein